MEPGGLFEKLVPVVEAGEIIIDNAGSGRPVGDESLATLREQAGDALNAYNGSIFADQAMQLFPEFEQMGFSGILDSQIRDALTYLSKGPSDPAAVEAALACVTRSGEKAASFSDQINKLKSVSDYFGVKKREAFEADAIAVIQMSTETGNTKSNVDAFVEQMQAFQSVTGFCEPATNTENISNIRMISGEDTLIVADMSVEGASRLQALIGKVQHTRLNIREIENVCDKLTSIGVRPQIVEMLLEERALLDNFDFHKVRGFLSSFSGEERLDVSKSIARSVLSLMSKGARIDSVILNDKPAVALAEESPIAAVTTSQTPKEGSDVSIAEADAPEIENIDERLVDTIEVIPDDGADKKSDAADGMTETTTDPAHDRTEMTPDIVDEVKDVAGEIIEDVAEKTTDANNTVKDSLTEINKTVSETTDTADEIVNDIKGNSSSSLRSIWDTISRR